MAFISVTRLHLRSWRFFPAFMLAAFRSSTRAKNSEGNLAVKVLRDECKAFWTCTSWESEEAMRAFMFAKPHGPAMRKLLTWCDEASVVHWTQAEKEMPTWDEAHRRMQEEGRASKVYYPSTHHTAYRIRPTGPTEKRERRFK